MPAERRSGGLGLVAAIISWALLAQPSAAQVAAVVQIVTSAAELRAAVIAKSELIQLTQHVQFGAEDGPALLQTITSRTAIWGDCESPPPAFANYASLLNPGQCIINAGGHGRLFVLSGESARLWLSDVVVIGSTSSNFAAPVPAAAGTAGMASAAGATSSAAATVLSEVDREGGTILALVGSRVYLRDLTITGSGSAAADGGAVALRGATANVTAVTFLDNSSLLQGGGLAVRQSKQGDRVAGVPSVAMIRQSLFAGNSARNAFAIWFGLGSSTWMAETYFKDNVADTPPGGDGSAEMAWYGGSSTTIQTDDPNLLAAAAGTGASRSPAIPLTANSPFDSLDPTDSDTTFLARIAAERALRSVPEPLEAPVLASMSPAPAPAESSGLSDALKIAIIAVCSVLLCLGCSVLAWVFIRMRRMKYTSQVSEVGGSMHGRGIPSTRMRDMYFAGMERSDADADAAAAAASASMPRGVLASSSARESDSTVVHISVRAAGVGASKPGPADKPGPSKESERPGATADEVTPSGSAGHSTEIELALRASNSGSPEQLLSSMMSDADHSPVYGSPAPANGAHKRLGDGPWGQHASPLQKGALGGSAASPVPPLGIWSGSGGAARGGAPLPANGVGGSSAAAEEGLGAAAAGTDAAFATPPRAHTISQALARNSSRERGFVPPVTSPTLVSPRLPPSDSPAASRHSSAPRTAPPPPPAFGAHHPSPGAVPAGDSAPAGSSSLLQDHAAYSERGASIWDAAQELSGPGVFTPHRGLLDRAPSDMADSAGLGSTPPFAMMQQSGGNGLLSPYLQTPGTPLGAGSPAATPGSAHAGLLTPGHLRLPGAQAHAFTPDDRFVDDLPGARAVLSGSEESPLGGSGHAQAGLAHDADQASGIAAPWQHTQGALPRGGLFPGPDPLAQQPVKLTFAGRSILPNDSMALEDTREGQNDSSGAAGSSGAPEVDARPAKSNPFSNPGGGFKRAGGSGPLPAAERAGGLGADKSRKAGKRKGQRKMLNRGDAPAAQLFAISEEAEIRYTNRGLLYEVPAQESEAQRRRAQAALQGGQPDFEGEDESSGTTPSSGDSDFSEDLEEYEIQATLETTLSGGALAEQGEPAEDPEGVWSSSGSGSGSPPAQVIDPAVDLIDVNSPADPAEAAPSEVGALGTPEEVAEAAAPMPKLRNPFDD